MLFNFKESFDLTLADWISVLWHGLRLDISAGAYLMIIPVILCGIFCLFESSNLPKIINYYSYFFISLILLLSIVDMNLYSYWGAKLDITAFHYLRSPVEAFASVPFHQIIILLTIYGVYLYLMIYAYKKLVNGTLSACQNRNVKFSISSILLLGMLIIPARGGVGIAPLNIGSAYFHNKRFANHSAINVLWNTVYSLTEQKKLSSGYKFMEENKAQQMFKELYKNSSPTQFQVVKENANVLMIILEGFSDKIIGCLGGEPGITPNLDKICENSIVFANFFASGDRSNAGLAGILSGYPAQPLTSIINYPAKSEKLPFLLKPFHDKGYYTAFYYGGDIDFGNFRSYFTNSATDRLVTSDDFPGDLNYQKWGVPDEYLFERLLNDADSIKEPFFLYCFTLSSHEPFDFPGTQKFGSSNMDEKSKSGFHYTDKCLGKFIESARTKPWWENTLVIILADHGSRYPGLTENHVREKFHIPMIWTGGALTISDTIISKYSSQTDVAYTLLNQFGFGNADFLFSKDILDPSVASFAQYFFNNGFGFVSDSATLVFDNNINNYTIKEGSDTLKFEESAKAYLQIISSDFQLR